MDGRSPTDCTMHSNRVKGIFRFCASEMIFGKSSEFLCRFFCHNTKVTNQPIFVGHLQSYKETIRPLPTRPTFRTTFIPEALTTFVDDCVHSEYINPQQLHLSELGSFHVISVKRKTNRHWQNSSYWHQKLNA